MICIKGKILTMKENNKTIFRIDDVQQVLCVFENGRITKCKNANEW